MYASLAVTFGDEDETKDGFLLSRCGCCCVSVEEAEALVLLSSFREKDEEGWQRGWLG